MIACVGAFLLFALCSGAQTPSRALLVLEKDGNKLNIIDPTSLKILAKLPAGEDPHEVVASADGKLAYISNYGLEGSSLHTISVVDLVAQKVLPPIDLGALRSTHGLAYAGGKLYFTAETSKVIGRYDPTTKKVDWVMGTGQDRTHMVWVAPSLDRIVTSNVRSGTISIIELVPIPKGTFLPSDGDNKTRWEVTNVPVGAGGEGFDISPDGKEIWVANAGDGTVSVIDIAGKKVTQTFPIAVIRANRLKFTPDGKTVLISGLGERGTASNAPDLVVLDAASHKGMKQLKLGGGSAGILMDPVDSRVFVAVSGANKIVVVDLRSFTVTRELSPFGNVDGMAWAVRK